MYGQKRINFFPQPEISVIANLVRSRCSLIGRSYLSDITNKCIQIQKYNSERGLCYLRIRDMTYVLNVLPGKERFSTFEGSSGTYSDRTRHSKPHRGINRNGNYVD